MSNRWLRFGIALLAIAAAAAAGYRIFQQEQRLATSVADVRRAELSVETALVTISEVKAALHAYVAEGQGDAFWTARAAALIDRLRASILAIDPITTASGAALTDTLDLADRLGVAEQRAREHVSEGQRLLAGEVIFTEARDLLEAMRLQLVGARTAIAEAALRNQSAGRREQATLALGGAGILAFATLLLVIPGTNSGHTQTPSGTPEWRGPGSDEYSSTGRLFTQTPVGQTTPAANARASGVVHEVPHAVGPPSERIGSGVRTTRSGSSPTVTPVAATTSAAPSVSLRDAAAVCTDFGRVSQSIEIAALLERAAKVLGASGAIVWMASPDGQEMYPAASAGYDERLLARIGAITRDASNVTAAAFRDASPRTSASIGGSAAALAVPLMTPLGPVGVFSAEIREGSTVDETRLAIATIFAAQLATLLGSISPPATVEVPAGEGPRAAKAQA